MTALTLQMVKQIIHRIFLFVSFLYVGTGVLLSSHLFPQVQSVMAYIHVFTFLPAGLFLLLNLIFLILTFETQKNPETSTIPTSRIILASMVGLLGIGTLFWILSLK